MDKNNLRQKLENQNIEGFDVSITPPKSAGNYIAVKRVGDLGYVSGQMSVLSSGVVLRSGEDNAINFGYKAAKIAMANALKQLIYSKNVQEVLSIVRVDGYFNNQKGNDLAKMLDGASDLVSSIMGEEKGVHARTVFGVHSVPYNAFVEIVVIAEVK